MVTSPSSDELRLPFYFPKSKPQCSSVTKHFFDCFSEKSVKKIKGDTQVGVRALEDCKAELEAYEKCMEQK